MTIMSIESIERDDIDGNELESMTTIDLQIKDTYKKRLDSFTTAYANSSLRRDPKNIPKDVVMPTRVDINLD